MVIDSSRSFAMSNCTRADHASGPYASASDTGHLAAVPGRPYDGAVCDTLFVPSSATSSGSAFFGKNSDRNPDEPQVMTLASGPRWPSLLSRPVWMRGAEMGINARGVVIGNEAVRPRHSGKGNPWVA